MSFNHNLRDLSPKQQLAFAAAIAERMLPNYQLFSSRTDDDAHLKVRAILDTVWEHLTIRGSRIDFAKQAEKLQELVPDTVGDESLGSYLALDTSLAVDHCLQLLLQADDEQVVSISRLSRASVARFLEVTEPETAEGRLSEQPLMQYEHECQNEILAFVQAHESSPNDMKALRQMIKEQEVSSIGIER
ncbi:YjaG family protein [Echinimonas agarilytica]|uniref:YjaG family protein n=1 Tax=Echinimonas agarilytica TaxID=1215918 RepID=A0AA41W965_9GAMM|nr:YjaG family protein [Echinimonas agarilytica]MCM2681031.1 YjaG family protein [Echinimonas agarilytica]